MTYARSKIRQESGRRGFTLVEILIVVVILGILAAIVIPQFSNASQTTRDNTLKDELRYLRSQVIIYQAQHYDVSPGYPGGNNSAAPTSTDFQNQMTMYTDARGNSSATYTNLYQYGPYLSKMPMNPVSSMTTITIVPDGATMPQPVDGTTGFFFQPQTNTWEANLPGNGTDGMPYINY